LVFTGNEFKIFAICPSGHFISGHGPGPLFFGGTMVGIVVFISSVTIGAIVVVVVVDVVVFVVIVGAVVVVVVVVVKQLISSSGQS